MNTYNVTYKFISDHYNKVKEETIPYVADRYEIDNIGNLTIIKDGEKIASFAIGVWSEIHKKE